MQLNKNNIHFISYVITGKMYENIFTKNLIITLIYKTSISDHFCLSTVPFKYKITSSLQSVKSTFG